MKKTGILFMIGYYMLLGAVLLTNFSFAQVGTRGKYGRDPTAILDTVVSKANQDYEIQETALDGITNDQGGYAKEYKIANTLEYFKNNIQPYIQWAVYVGLTCAVILLIYNGFLMVTGSIHKEGDSDKIKKNVTNIAIGVIVLTGFYTIIKLMVAVINMIFGSNGGESGF
ncbi:MAG: hypothetical protein WAZ12_00995 [Candidatus Absconditicoccaceae bacterium]